MKTKFILKISSLLLVGYLMFSCSKDSLNPTEPPANDPPKEYNASTDNVVINHELRAAWLTTAWKLDWPGTATTANDQKALLISIIDRLKSMNINVIFFQVMTSCEAFYPSQILPWTAYLTGTQGQDPGYDPLAIAIQAAHERGMEMHAWINPLRVGSATQYYAPNHPALAHPNWYCTYSGVRYWNAGLPEVRTYLQNVVKEIVNNYDIDGIHFDDYFYPDGLKATPKEWDDNATFLQYGGGKNLDSWREYNIDLMVKAVHDAIQSTKPKVVFGISPSGQYANTLALYANPVNWIRDKSIDYLAPQIYWQIGHPTADFDKLARFWSAQSQGIPIFPGLAAYRLGESGFPTAAEFLKEVTLCRSLSNVLGNCWFRTEFILKSDLNNYIKQNIYPSLSLVPKMGPFSQTVPSSPSVSMNQRTLTWNAVAGASRYAVYELERVGKTNVWNALAKYIGTNTTFEGTSNKNYLVIAVNGREKSSHQKVFFIK